MLKEIRKFVLIKKVKKINDKNIANQNIKKRKLRGKSC